MTRTLIFSPFIFLVLFLSLFASSLSYAELVIRADENDYPATYVREGQWRGMDIELLREMLKRAGLSYRIEHIPFKRSLVEMREGAVDIIPNLVKNEGRSEFMVWIGPTRITCIGLVVQAKDRDINIESTDALIVLSEQRDQKIGYLTGASYSPILDDRLENDEKLKTALHFLPSNEQHRQMLTRGRILGYFYDKFEVRQRMLDQDFASRFKGLALNSHYQVEQSCNGAYIGISKRVDAPSIKRLQNDYRSMADDGFFEDVHLKWVGEIPKF